MKEKETVKKEKNVVEEVEHSVSIFQSLFGNFYNGLTPELSFWLTQEFDKDFWFPDSPDVEYNLNQYDYEFQQLLIKKVIKYCKMILQDVISGSSKKEIKPFVEQLKDEDVLTWHDIYSILIVNFKNKSIANFIKEQK